MSATLGKAAAVSVAKVVEITATSPKSFEDAIHAGIARASKTLEGIQGSYGEGVVVYPGMRIRFFVPSLFRRPFLP